MKETMLANAYLLLHVVPYTYIHVNCLLVFCSSPDITLMTHSDAIKE